MLLLSCIESLLDQTYPSTQYEVVIIDDGSDDDTQSVIAAFTTSASIPVVRYERIPHSGMVAARLRGISLSTGELVAFIDDDAQADRSWLAELVEGLVDSAAAAVGGPIIPAPTQDLTAKIAPNGELLWSGFYSRPRSRIVDVDFVPGGNMIVRKDVLTDVGSFDPEFDGIAWREETDVCLRLRRRGYRICFIRDALVEHHSRRWRHRVRIRPGFQFSQGKNHAYFVGKNFSGQAAVARCLLLEPLGVAWQSTVEIIANLVALVIVPIQWAGRVYGLLLGRRRRQRTES